MKRLTLLLIAVILPLCLPAQKYLKGKVRVVTSFADYKVKVVNSFPDLNVKIVTRTPSACGEWQMVNSHADFTVEFVNAFEDFSICYVDAFPGLPSGSSKAKANNDQSSASTIISSKYASGGFESPIRYLSCGTKYPYDYCTEYINNDTSFFRRYWSKDIILRKATPTTLELSTSKEYHSKWYPTSAKVALVYNNRWECDFRAVLLDSTSNRRPHYNVVQVEKKDGKPFHWIIVPPGTGEDFRVRVLPDSLYNICHFTFTLQKHD